MSRKPRFLQVGGALLMLAGALALIGVAAVLATVVPMAVNSGLAQTPFGQALATWLGVPLIVIAAVFFLRAVVLNADAAWRRRRLEADLAHDVLARWCCSAEEWRAFMRYERAQAARLAGVNALILAATALVGWLAITNALPRNEYASIDLPAFLILFLLAAACYGFGVGLLVQVARHVIVWLRWLFARRRVPEVVVTPVAAHVGGRRYRIQRRYLRQVQALTTPGGPLVLRFVQSRAASTRNVSSPGDVVSAVVPAIVRGLTGSPRAYQSLRWNSWVVDVPVAKGQEDAANAVTKAFL